MNSRVLLVDDNSELLHSLERLLETEYRVFVAPNGDEALSVCEAHGPFALIISDQEMPGMGGVELLARMLERWPETERVLMSASSDVGLALRAINEGRVFHFLTKPAAPEAIRSVVDEAVARFRERENQRLLTEQLSFARESLISMSATLERRLAVEMRRLRTVEDFGMGLANVQSVETIAHLTVEALQRIFEGKAVRLVMGGHQYFAGDTELRPATSSYWREPIHVAEDEEAEVFLETDEGGPGTTERRLLRLVCAFASLAAQTRLHRGSSRDAKLRAIRNLADLAEGRSEHALEHHAHVGAFCCVIAEEMGSNGRDKGVDAERFLEDLDLAARLHDIGKAGIPASILDKPGTLTEEEWEVIRRHPLAGAETLRSALESSGEESSLRMAYEIALNHHECWDGGGYPRGLKGENIPLSARILTVADCYDALTSQRPYKEPWTHEDSVAYLREEKGKRFDPLVVDAFLARAEEIRELREEFAQDSKRTGRSQAG